MDDDTTLTFRDGPRVVPAHLYPELSQLETERMTYEEALRAADNARMRKFLGNVQHDVIAGHFASQRRGF